jgi:hypothetical protein
MARSFLKELGTAIADGVMQSLTEFRQKQADQLNKLTGDYWDKERAMAKAKQANERAVVLFNMPKASKQLKMMATLHGTTVQALLTEAINDLFKKHGLPSID